MGAKIFWKFILYPCIHFLYQKPGLPVKNIFEISEKVPGMQFRHSGAGRNPVFSKHFWTPAFAGVIAKKVFQRSLFKKCLSSFERAGY